MLNHDEQLGNGLVKYASQKELQRELDNCPKSPETSQGSRLKRHMEAREWSAVALSAKTNNKVSVAKITACIMGGKELSDMDLTRVCQAMGIKRSEFEVTVEKGIAHMPEWHSLGNELMQFPYEQRVRVITAIRNSLQRYKKGTY